MCDDLDGCVVFDDGRDTMFSSSSGYGIGTHRTNSQCHDPDGSANGHAPQHITFAGGMRHTVFLKMPFNDFTLLARVMNRRCSHCNSNSGYSEGEWDSYAGDGGRSGSTRNETCVMFPFPLQFFGRKAIAFRIVGLEIEGHIKARFSLDVGWGMARWNEESVMFRLGFAAAA